MERVRGRIGGRLDAIPIELILSRQRVIRERSGQSMYDTLTNQPSGFVNATPSIAPDRELQLNPGFVFLWRIGLACHPGAQSSLRLNH
jgi:hypothetical protein